MLAYQMAQEGKEMITTLLTIALIIALLKWFLYYLGTLAILLYYAECGQELPDQDTIRKYQAKALLKLLGIKTGGK